MGEGPFLGSFLEEHPDDRSHIVLHLDHKDLLVIADENRAAAIRRQYAPDRDGHILLHIQSLDAARQNTSRKEPLLQAKHRFIDNLPSWLEASLTCERGLSKTEGRA